MDDERRDERREERGPSATSPNGKSGLKKARTMTVPPSGVNFKLLLIKLRITWCEWVGRGAQDGWG